MHELQISRELVQGGSSKKAADKKINGFLIDPSTGVGILKKQGANYKLF